MHFYVLRFLLGLAEAGFFPGMMLYLTYWFPNAHRGQAAAQFIVAGSVAGIIGGPLGALLLKLNGVGGLHGWQWLFLLEGIPSFLLGFVVLFYMTDKPEKAHWLLPEERDWLIRTLAREQTHRQKFHHMSLASGAALPARTASERALLPQHLQRLRSGRVQQPDRTAAHGTGRDQKILYSSARFPAYSARLS